ncbi:hypothetical protein BGZ94_004838 [Podila epigama]|nr:hypothetical protein BGZ94_004838 [Podila epigama]
MVSPSFQALAKKLLVVGGTGGVGNAQAQARRGEPVITNAPGSATSGSWIKKVDWAKGDSLDPTTYTDAIKDANAVVHTVGILLEDNYKEVLHSQSIEDLTKNIQSAIQGHNPLDTNKKHQTGLTYEKINRDTALTVANEAGKAGVDSFVYISAAFSPPMVPNRYLTTKREAESALLTHPSNMRSIIFRPGFMSTPERPITLPFAGLLQLSSMVLGNSVRGTIPFAQALSTPPLAMETLARAVMNAIENQEIKGIVDVNGIEELANNPHSTTVGASTHQKDDVKRE